MRTRLFTAAAAAAVLTVACTQTTEDPVLDSESSIVGGQTDTRHAAVAFLQYELVGADGTNKGTFVCSATLVTPTVLLTAAHCVVPPGVASGDRYRNHRAYFGTTPERAKKKELFRAKKAVAHPSYDPKVLGAYDVATVVLEREVPIRPVKVARSFGNLLGQSVTHVGWGASVSNGKDDKGGIGTKRAVTLPVTEQQGALLRTGDGTRGICNGDSGGPALLATGDDDVVVGVHSWVDDVDRCAKNGFSARVDRYVDFLADTIASAFVDVRAAGDEAAPPPPSASGGQCCVDARCYACATKSALDACVGLDIDACFAECGQDPSCLVGCADRLGKAKHDPSACTPTTTTPKPRDDGQNGESCSTSVACNDGQCRCGGAKAGVACDGRSGLPSSCDVVCRVCR